MEERWNKSIREARMRMLVRAEASLDYSWLKYWAGRSWKELKPELREALIRWID